MFWVNFSGEPRNRACRKRQTGNHDPGNATGRRSRSVVFHCLFALSRLQFRGMGAVPRRYAADADGRRGDAAALPRRPDRPRRSEEHTSELQSLMRNSYAVFCLKKKLIQKTNTNNYKTSTK